MKNLLLSSLHRRTVLCGALVLICICAYGSPVKLKPRVIWCVYANGASHSPSPRPIATGKTDEDGKFTSGILKAGTYTVEVPPGPGRTVQIQVVRGCVVKVNGKLWDIAKPIPLQDTCGIEITIGDNGGAIAGIVCRGVDIPAISR